MHRFLRFRPDLISFHSLDPADIERWVSTLFLKRISWGGEKGESQCVIAFLQCVIAPQFSPRPTNSPAGISWTGPQSWNQCTTLEYTFLGNWVQNVIRPIHGTFGTAISKSKKSIWLVASAKQPLITTQSPKPFWGYVPRECPAQSWGNGHMCKNICSTISTKNWCFWHLLKTLPNFVESMQTSVQTPCIQSTWCARAHFEVHLKVPKDQKHVWPFYLPITNFLGPKDLSLQGSIRCKKI